MGTIDKSAPTLVRTGMELAELPGQQLREAGLKCVGRAVYIGDPVTLVPLTTN